MPNKEQKVNISRLNDQLRRHHTGGRVMLTAGINALGIPLVAKVMGEIARFEGFSADNDPYGEHDCAVLTIEGRRVIWKIDYYDKGMEFSSPDPADPAVTERVMTVMLGEEY